MNIKNNLEKGISGMLWMLSMTIIVYIIQLVMTFFLARILTPGDYGEMAAIGVLIGFAEIFWMMGVGPAIVQKKNLSKNDILTGNTLNVIFGFIIFFIINFFAEFLCNIFSISDSKMLRVFSVIFIMNSLSGVPKSLTQKKCNYKRMALIKLYGIIIYGSFAITFALLNFNVWSLIIASLAQVTFNTIVYIFFEPIKLTPHINKNSAKKLLYFGGGFTIARIFSYIANNGDYFVINKTLGKSLLGSYTKAYQLLMYPVSLIGESLDQVLFPMLSQSQDDKEKLQNIFISGTGLIALVSVPISLVAFICAEPLVYFVLGEQWGEVILPFKIMIIGLFFRIGYKLSDSLIRALGKVYQRAHIQAIYAFFVVLGAYLGHFFGLEGVALGVTCSFTINYFLMSALSMHYTNVKISDLVLSILPSFFYGFITFISISFMKQYLFSLNNYFLICLVVTIICFGIYCILFILTRKIVLSTRLNQFVNEIFNSIIRMLKK